MQRVEKQLEAVVFPPTEDGTDPRTCPLCKEATLMLRISGSVGGFVACSNYGGKDSEGAQQGCQFRRHMLPEDGVIDAPGGGAVLGSNPDSGHDVKLVEGPYGRRAAPCLAMDGIISFELAFVLRFETDACLSVSVWCRLCRGSHTCLCLLQSMHMFTCCTTTVPPQAPSLQVH